MRKFYALILAVLLFAALPAAAFAFAGGDGTEGNPYIITEAAHLNAVRDNLTAHYKLNAHIDLTAYLADGGDGDAQWGEEGWEPIGGGYLDNNTAEMMPFNGSFDGAGFKITGLWINRPKMSYAGLFGLTEKARITSLGVELAPAGIIGNSDIGGIVGGMRYSSEGIYDNSTYISSCYVTGNVIGNENVGGLSGSLENSNIENCYTVGNISGASAVGGLVGRLISTDPNKEIIIQNCYSTCKVIGGDQYVGGLLGTLVGSIDNDARVSNSYATGSVSGGRDVGGLVGSSVYTTITNSYRYKHLTVNGNIITDNNPSGLHGGVMTYEQLKNMQTYVDNGWKFFDEQNRDNPWVWDENGFPRLGIGSGEATEKYTFKFSTGGGGTEADPYIITEPEQLDDVRNNRAFHYKLGNDIDLTAYLAEGGFGRTQWGADGWNPIGHLNSSFTGSLDGAWFKITGLWINRQDTDYVGLFGSTEGATIKNLGVENVGGGVNGNNYVGGIVGGRGGNISNIINCYATGFIGANSNAGGLIGDSAIITNSYSFCNVLGTSPIGGLAGTGGTITNSYAVGYIGRSLTNGGQGGLAGQSATVTSSYAAVSIGDFRSGGLTGEGGTITSSYRYVNSMRGGHIIPATEEGSVPDGRHGGTVTIEQLMNKQTYINNGWSFNDSNPAGPWRWDDRGFPTLSGGAADFPFITVDIEPEYSTLNEGNSIVLRAAASVPEGTNPQYQWYSNTTEENFFGTGTAIPEATGAVFTIPNNLPAAEDPYYYFCIVSADGALPKPSNLADVRIVPKDTAIVSFDVREIVGARGDTEGFEIIFSKPVTGLTRDKIDIYSDNRDIEFYADELTDAGDDDERTYRVVVSRINSNVPSAPVHVTINEWDGVAIEGSRERATEIHMNLSLIRVNIAVSEADGESGMADTKTFRVNFSLADGSALPTFTNILNSISFSKAGVGETGIKLDSLRPVAENPGEYIAVVSYPATGSVADNSVLNLNFADWSEKDETGTWKVFTALNSPELTIYRDLRTLVNYTLSASNNTVESNYPILTNTVTVNFSTPVPLSFLGMLTYDNASIGGWSNVSGDETSALWSASVTDAQTGGKPSVLSSWNLIIPAENRQYKTSAPAQSVTLYKDTRTPVSYSITGSGSDGTEDTDKITFTFTGLSDGISSLYHDWNFKIGTRTYGGSQITQLWETVAEGQSYALSLQGAGISFNNGDTLTVDMTGAESRYHTIDDPVKSVSLWKKPIIEGVMRLDSVSPATAHVGSLNTIMLLGLLKTDSAQIDQVIFSDDVSGKAETVSVTLEDQGNEDYVTVNVQGVQMLKAVGDYKVSFRGSDGKVSESKPLSIRDNTSLRQNGYGILAVTQAAGGALTVGAYNSESELKGAGSALITFRGNIAKMDDGSFRVSAGATLNGSLMFIGGPTDTISVSRNGGNVTIAADNLGHLSWNGVPLTPILRVPSNTPRFRIELDSSTIYRTVRNGYGDADIEIIPDTLGERGLGITLLGVQAETNRIKLYRDAASVGGYIKLGKNMDYIGEASLTLHEMILGTRTGMPLMNVEGKVKVDMSKIVNLGSMNFSGESEFMLQNIDLPGSFGIKAQVELGKALYLEGEFVLMWGVKNGRNIVVPDTIKFFARSNYIGVPLIPPTVVAYLTGFGGGFSGLGKTILGSNTIPQLTLEVSVGLQDALGGAILQIDKVTLKVGLVETSIYAQEARILYGAVTLTDVGAGTGLVEPATGNKLIPDVYFKAGGNASVLNGALKGGLNFNLQVHVNTLGDELKKYFSDSASSTQDGNIIQKMLNAIDFQGKAFIEGGVNFVLGYLEMGLDAAVNRQSLSGTIYGSVGTWLGSLDASVSATYYYGRALEFEIFGYPVRVPSRVMNGVNRRIGKPITITPAKPKAFRTMADEPEAEQEHLLLSNLYSYGMYMPDDGVPDGVSTFRALADENELIPGNGRITIDDMDAGNIAVFYSRTRPATINVSYNGAAQAPFNPQWVDGVAGVDIDGDGVEDTGLYAAHYKADSGGNWAFEAEGLLGAMRVNIFKLPSIEGVEAEVAGDGKLEVTWTHDTGETHSGTDMYVNLLLIDADTGDIVSNLIPSDPISPDQSYKNYPEAGISEYNEASIPSSLPSGRYYVSARLLHMATPTYTDEAGTAEAMDDTEPEKMEITLGIQNSPMFNYSNSAAPSVPGNLTVTDAANGALNVTWDKVSDADGYIVTALSGNGAPLDSFGEIDIQSGDVTTVVLNAGLSAYTLTTSGDADSERVSGLEYGKSYQISVRAYSAKTYTAQVENEEGVLEDNVNTIIVPGEAAMTPHTMRTPAIPQLSVTAAGGTLIERKDGNGQVTETLFAVRSHDVTFTVTSNVNASINVYLDDNENGGTLLEAGTNTNELSFSHSFENDGMYALRVEAVNGLDTGSGGMNLLVDTAAPFLDVDNDSFNARDGRFRVTGFAEQEAVLTVDGTLFENITDAERTDGVFTFERAAESIVTTVQLTATDLAGNTSSRLLTIMPLSASEMTASALEPFGSLEVGYPQPAAQTVTVTNSGTNVITLTQPTAVNYEIGALSAATIAANGGTATFTVQPKAGLQAGNYDETIVITGSGGASASVAASFSVTGGEFVPVTSITGVPTAAKAGTSLTLTGTVNPENASNKSITWSVADAGTTGATINGSTLSTPTTGTVIITATVVNGTADGNYAQNFSITVTAGDIDPNNKATIAGGEFNLSENSNGDGWNWDAATKTLTLTGEADLGDIAFVTGDNVTVSLAGDNITAKSVTNTGAGDIAITSAQGKSLTLNAPNGPAISAMGNVTIDSGTVYALTLDVNADAIHAGGSVTISGTANVTAEITSGYGSAVSAGRNINISTSGNVKATADAGISLEAETITITGGKVELVFNEPKGGKAYNKTPEISGGASVTVNEKPLLPEEEEPTPTGPTNPTGPSDPNNPTNPDPTDPGGYEGDGSEGGSGCNSVNLYMMAFLLTLPLLRKPK